MSTLLHANNDLVATAWLKAILGVTSGVGTELPGDQATWAATGFVQHSVVGGTPDAYSSQHRPVYGINCWSVAQNSRQPPWALANHLAEQIRYAALAAYQHPLHVVLPAAYANAAVQSAYVTQEPRRIPGDASSFGRYQMDLRLFWIETP